MLVGASILPFQVSVFVCLSEVHGMVWGNSSVVGEVRAKRCNIDLNNVTLSPLLLLCVLYELRHAVLLLLLLLSSHEALSAVVMQVCAFYSAGCVVMLSTSVRVRFAPAPTGFMHIGNLRAALFNYLFARQNGGTFILRIEDTDVDRTITGGVERIITDLQWFGTMYDEGPGAEQGDDSYFQSERTEIYVRALARLIEAKAVYPCFCTPEELDALRDSQRAAGLPPRYDGRCRALPHDRAVQLRSTGTPFVWRLRCPAESLTVMTLERGEMTFDMSHFYDIPLTRSDESFTFLFANCVDDCEMAITHVIRGDDHLNNMPLQVVLYRALGFTPPVFAHLPLICNNEGKKMSKRDFGFSLGDLRTEGILPVALAHYLYMIGKTTIPGRYDTLEALGAVARVEERLTTHAIQYDFAALRSLNQTYLQALTPEALREHVIRCVPESAEWIDFLVGAGDRLFALAVTEGATLSEIARWIGSIALAPVTNAAALTAHCGGDAEQARALLRHASRLAETMSGGEAFVGAYEAYLKEAGIHRRIGYGVLRYALMGVFHGCGLRDLVALIPHATVIARLASAAHAVCL